MPKPLELALLLAHADDGAPVVSKAFSQEDARGMNDPADERISGQMRDHGADPNDLAKQHYGVLAPDGARGDRLLELVRPLLESRRAEQGGLPIVEARLPGNVDTNDARTFRDRLLSQTAPRYWLVLGDLHEISLETTFVLAANAFVGRLSFSNDADYESYVDKVLRWERRPSSSTTGQTVLCSVRDGTPATAFAHRALMRPLEDACASERAKGRFSTSGVSLVEARSLSDLDMPFRSSEPTVLFSSSHGVGPPRGGYDSHQEQLRLSGAMSIGPDKLTGDDVRSGSFLPGGIWFYLACYGAGTPSRSAFEPWLRDMVDRGAINRDAAAQALSGLPMPDTAPFIAALPKAALANPNGPLAMLGHVDLAWSSAFADPVLGTDQQPMRFLWALRALVQGRRAGIAHGELTRYLLDTALTLADMYDEEKRGNAPRNDREREVRKAHYWMRRHDLGHYVLLGDPAVRLPLTGNRVVHLDDGDVADVEIMEKAALAVLGRGDSAEIVAKQMNLAAADVALWAKEYAAAGRERLGKMRGNGTKH